MTAAGTPFTPPALAHYRERHVIRPVREWVADFDRIVEVCAHDSIQVHPREGGYVHDATEIRRLAARERGEGWRG